MFRTHLQLFPFVTHSYTHINTKIICTEMSRILLLHTHTKLIKKKKQTNKTEGLVESQNLN
jgi:hypothetical protein